MAPLSKTNIGCEKSLKIDEEILNISEKFNNIDLEKNTEDEQSTYIIDDESSETNTDTDELDNCETIKEKGLIAPEKFNNNRLLPYGRNTTQRRQIHDNYDEQIPDNIYNIYYPDTNNFNYDETYNLFSFNNLDPGEVNQLLNVDDLINDQSINDESINENTPDFLTNNIPLPVEEQNNPTIQLNTAETNLSNYIDQHKKLKQEIWILVNIENEHKLISKLNNKIRSARFNQTNLNYIYAIIIRLMKEDGKELLRNYLTNDDILFKIALKQNILLMNFILEVYYNLGIDLNQSNVLLEIIDHSHIDLFDAFKTLINYKYNINNSNGQSVLMVLLKNMAKNKGVYNVNMKYLDLFLSQLPDINFTTNDGKNIFHHMYIWQCDEQIIQKIKCNYNEAIINNLMCNFDFSGRLPQDYLQCEYQF